MDTFIGIILVLIASAITAITVYFDNYIVDVIFRKKSIFCQKIFYAVFHLILLIILFLFFPIDSLDSKSIFFTILSGAAYSLALIPYYFALKKNNSTTVEIFSQFEPIVCLIFGMVFFGEFLNSKQFIAFVLIFSVGLLVILFQDKKKGRKVNFNTALLVILAASMWALADLTFSTVDGDSISYITALFYTVLGRELVDIFVVIFLRKERKQCLTLFKKNGVKKLWPLLADYVLEVGSDLVYRFGLLLAPVAIGSAVAASSELIFTFIFGIILTLLVPKFGRESLKKRPIMVNSIATIILIIGIILVQ